MKETMIRAERKAQMKDIIESMMLQIGKGTYRTATFCKANKLPTVFPTFMVEAGLIKPIDKAGNRLIYSNQIPRSVIKDKDVENVIDIMQRYNRKVYERKQANAKAKKEAKAKETKSGIEKMQTELGFTRTPLEKYPFSELKEEIEKRGVVFQPKLEDIDITRIMEELRSRGYTGEISKIEEYKI